MKIISNGPKHNYNKIINQPNKLEKGIRKTK